jgi:phage antirepressor YoqD-like protein
MQFIGDEKKMTVKEVAESIGYESETIRKKVKDLFPDIVEPGKATLLSEDQVYILRKTLLPRTLALKSGVENAVTSLDIEEMTLKVIEYHRAEAARLRIENEAQREQLAIDAPKVAFFDSVTSSKDAIDMKDAAKVLNIGIGRNTLFQKLRDAKILMENNTPYQAYIDRGYFRVIESRWITPQGETKISLKTVVYQRGLDFILKEIRR